MSEKKRRKEKNREIGRGRERSGRKETRKVGRDKEKAVARTPMEKVSNLEWNQVSVS